MNTNSDKSIKRSAGITPAERYLKKLCDRSFLSLWSYASIYRDQKSGTGAEGKEVADLIVVFGEDIIIFSDKYCIFPNTGDTTVDWTRWFRRAVESSAAQAWGAERWIRNYPTRLFLDKACTQQFPLEISSPESLRFHLVVVAHDVSRRCRAEYGGSGSLMINNDLKGILSHTEPFTIGDLNPDKSFVHVLDDTTLDVLLATLDTISDFTAYLRKKEVLFRAKRELLAAGEEELLALYLTSLNGDDEHDFVFPRAVKDATGIALSEGHWQGFEKNPQRKAQIEANKISYVWDRLIEKFNHYALRGQQYFSSEPALLTSEKILRFLAREPRTRRRMLGRSLMEILRSTPSTIRAIRVVQPSSYGDPYYVFLLFPFCDEFSYEDNRVVRRNFLEACCQVTKLKFSDAEDIVGFATESGFANNNRSEDIVHLDARKWSVADNEQAREVQQKLEILLEPREFRRREREYPELSTSNISNLQPNPRNKLCPCGSTLKYKRCHGR